MDRRYCAARCTLSDGNYNYYAGVRCGYGVERGDFATRKEAAELAAELNKQPGHRPVPPLDPTRCGFCGGPTPCLRID